MQAAAAGNDAELEILISGNSQVDAQDIVRPSFIVYMYGYRI